MYCLYCSEFISWKCEEEAKSTSRFVARRGAVRNSSGCRTVYYCNRSGVHVSEATGKRQLKSQGSVRSGHCCPASMSVYEHDGSVSVTYYSTHHGHEKKLCHLSVAASEREQIAGNKCNAYIIASSSI